MIVEGWDLIGGLWVPSKPRLGDWLFQDQVPPERKMAYIVMLVSVTGRRRNHFVPKLSYGSWRGVECVAWQADTTVCGLSGWGHGSDLFAQTCGRCRHGCGDFTRQHAPADLVRRFEGDTDPDS